MRDFENVVKYKVKVKNGAGWRQYDTARLQISVGGPRHEGEKFKATVDWVGQNFKKATICVNDTLQRFNFQLSGMSEQEAFEASMAAGRDWFRRHMAEIETLPNVSLYRWEEWKTDAFERRHAEVCARYEADPVFYQSVQDSQKNKLSIPYILEEVAVFSLMYEKENAVDVYPGTLPSAMYVFSHQHQTRIDFARLRA